MSELFLKQVLNQGSRQFFLYRRKCVDEKKKLFEQLDAKQKIRSAMKKDIKAAKKNMKILQNTFAEKNGKIAKDIGLQREKTKGVPRTKERARRMERKKLEDAS